METPEYAPIQRAGIMLRRNGPTGFAVAVCAPAPIYRAVSSFWVGPLLRHAISAEPGLHPISMFDPLRHPALAEFFATENR